MAYKRLFIWVEGPDDLRFFEEVIKPKFKMKYDLVEIRSYANLKKEKFLNFLKSIRSMGGEYLYVRDINDAPCVSFKKQQIFDKLHIDNEKVIIVIKEIESWYLAGLNEANAKKLKIKMIDKTDDITKEKFNSLMPIRFTSRIDFMAELLKDYSMEIAFKKNKSLLYFIKIIN
jgi:hypothetical protein